MKHSLVILFLLFCAFVNADETVNLKPLQKAAKSAIKNSKDQEKAEKNLMDVVNAKGITNKERAGIYFTALELRRSMHDQENLKLYLKQSYDTIKFFSTILKMYEYGLLCDSVERAAGEKFTYRTKSRDILLMHRKNLLNGGKYLLRSGKEKDAFHYFDMYMRTPEEPMFEFTLKEQNDTLRPKVAYWATISAYNSNQPEKALIYMDNAISGADSSLRVSLTEYKIRCYEALNDSSNWLFTLKSSVNNYPRHDYFYLHLMDYYLTNKMYDKGILLTDNMLNAIGSRSIYWYGKSQMLLEKGEYNQCIECADSAIMLDSVMVDAYYNKGMGYLNNAIAFSQTVCNDIRNPRCKKDRAKLKGMYRLAQAPLEKVRELTPNDINRWGEPLYTIYLNLNLGDKFAEVERLLKDEE